MIARLWRDESGQGLPEYALLVAAVVVLVVVVAALWTDSVEQMFNEIEDYIESNGPLP